MHRYVYTHTGTPTCSKYIDIQVQQHAASTAQGYANICIYMIEIHVGVNVFTLTTMKRTYSSELAMRDREGPQTGTKTETETETHTHAPT